jgi:aromatic ring hydroxylase
VDRLFKWVRKCVFALSFGAPCATPGVVVVCLHFARAGRRRNAVVVKERTNSSSQKQNFCPLKRKVEGCAFSWIVCSKWVRKCVFALSFGAPCATPGVVVVCLHFARTGRRRNAVVVRERTNPRSQKQNLVVTRKMKNPRDERHERPKKK